MTRRSLHFARQLQQNLRPQWAIDGPWQWGTVSAVSLGAGATLTTVSVYLDNSSSGTGATVTAGIPLLSNYMPNVGDTVLIGRMQGASRTQRFVIGQMSSGNSRPSDGGTVVCGPPLAGIAQEGDVVTDLTTHGRWICTVGGSPGTWIGDEGAITSPKAPTIVVNTAGAVSWWYAVAAVGNNGATAYPAIPSASVKITNGAVAGSQNNTVNWTAPLGVDATRIVYHVLRSTDGITFTRISTTAAGATTFTDNNATGVAYTAATTNPGGGYVVGGHQFRARAHPAASTSLANGATTKVTLATVDYNPNGDFSSANSNYPAPVSGTYRVHGGMQFGATAAAGALFNVAIYKTAGPLAAASATQGSSSPTSVSQNPRSVAGDTIYLNAGDIIDLRGFNASGSAVNCLALTDSTWLAVEYTGS